MELGPGEQDSAHQLSEGTDPLASAGQDTLPYRSSRKRLGFPPLVFGKRPSLPQAVGLVIALAIYTAISLLVGGVLGFLLRETVQ
jgi:hypothetical protein